MAEKYGHISSLVADRLGGEGFFEGGTLYKFGKIKEAKGEAVKNNPGVPLIDMGVGEPHMMADETVIDSLHAEAIKWENRGYSDNGIQEFKDAASRYMVAHFGVRIDNNSEVLHTVGAKNALAFLPMGFVNPGDTVITTVPGYPVMGTLAGWLGGEVYKAELRKENNFMPDLDSIPDDVLDRAKLFYVNYPNNPTGAQATEDFYENLVSKAKDHNFIVVQDGAYSLLTYGSHPESFLSVPGAKDVGIELHSVSKGYNMTGWRLAFAAGNEDVIKVLGGVKDNFDSGQFKAIQKAVAYAAFENFYIPRDTADEYQRRLEMMVEGLGDVGFDARMPDGTFFLYVPSPKGAGDNEFGSAEDASQYLIKECLISTVPWDDIPDQPHLRFSATFPTLQGSTEGMTEKEKMEAEKQTIDEMVSRMKEVNLRF
ncbi:MAG: aminotransferase class I/II-fold pyridoxal phosphate-dependent enzyme [Candidatus Woesearchaeota archaeon]